MPDDEVNAGGLHGVDHASAFGERYRERLLHQHMLAGGGRHADVFCVELMRGRHVNRFDICVGAELFN